ncbi:MAG: hypothetical protein ABI759_01555 [Candidatus Solibacter sp.]
MTQSTMSRSAICAADILEAWRENDPERLNQRLAKGATPDLEAWGDPLECERRELLHGIASRIACSIASGQVQDASVYIPLLQHLAKSESLLVN